LRLRAGDVRLLLRAGRRRGDPLLRDAGRASGRQVAHHARGAAGALCSAEGASTGACAASAAAGVHRRAVAALRLLLQRHDHQGRRALGAEPEADRCADPRPYGRTPVPLWHLSARHEGHQGGVRQNRGRDAMTTSMQNELPFSRRDLLKGGGALIIGFSLSGVLAPAIAARGDVAGPPDPNTVDTWIAIHADNTASVYFGKC